MKNVTITFSILAFVATLSFAQTNMVEEVNLQEVTQQEVTQLTVELIDLNSDEGHLRIGLYDSAGNWLNSTFKGQVSEIKNGTATVVFENVPHGEYGISAYHDKDDNKKLNSGIFGIPTEPYANSRGAKGRFGPPKWKDAVFTLSNEKATETIKF